ncbi:MULTISPECIES: hypothetical protein [Streptomyces]|uniref:hypothetical protein n=1 Tax=Streptomyces TaxID=1883 RepID=UPI001E3A01A5|nr:hypothetical protein [Streptomyces canarius]
MVNATGELDIATAAHTDAIFTAATLAGCRAVLDGTARAEAHWLDAIALPGARVALVAGAVTEDGSPAPALAPELRAAVRTLADMDLSPEGLLAHLAHVLTRLRFDGERSRRGEDASAVTVGRLYAVSTRCPPAAPSPARATPR